MLRLGLLVAFLYAAFWTPFEKDTDARSGLDPDGVTASTDVRSGLDPDGAP